jgi:hypothetical protein
MVDKDRFFRKQWPGMRHGKDLTGFVLAGLQPPSDKPNPILL